ncbi:hypothetical protein H310_13514 [Aphanomyces invadans]|uniref:Peptidase C1A papain C-terminal domain-containing protein n=1 Tax=Aphanomyces invadans TaxID=157072 RepID=A0A024TDL6_9STRA|nr:hypothetical protein H310_13514 [Aphanomyces invadans]ETV92104.1 hypothetical protein H310_13514 [Aphanomyces invadans]|eukprot:XP_008879266.1 hypothetical protein H310_13514 [Aphanomyces invadans]
MARSVKQLTSRTTLEDASTTPPQEHVAESDAQPKRANPIELFDRRGRPSPRLYNEQAKDPWIVALRAYLDDGAIPIDTHLLKLVTRNAQQYTIRQGIVCRYVTHETPLRNPELLVFAGHIGFTKRRERIRRTDYWLDWQQDWRNATHAGLFPQNIDWKNYREGVITHCPGSSSDHAVVAVGYDEKSYKLRNSWGDTWGERGYIRLQRGVGGRGMCNVAENIVYPKINRTPAPPRPAQCGSCTGCFYPFTRECLSHGKDYCDSNSASYGMIWCGAKPSSITATESTATMRTGTPYPTTTKASRTTTEPKLSA